jgi:hypothetical protein
LAVLARVDGTLLEQASTANLSVRLKRDVYVFHGWMSYDREIWLPGSEALSQKFEVSLPGVVDGRTPGLLSTTYDLR